MKIIINFYRIFFCNDGANCERKEVFFFIMHFNNFMMMRNKDLKIFETKEITQPNKDNTPFHFFSKKILV